jgi:glycosyltransferase involved in cell wall biosynthesis
MPICLKEPLMKVSVIIPTYNRAYIVREAIESGVSQTYQDFEIIVVDDGSTDNTAEIVGSVQDERIRYICHEKNRGYSAACNTGIRAAKGNIVGFLDSDDLWKPDYLDRLVCFFNRHPEVQVVFSDVEIIEEQRTIPSLINLMKSFPKHLKHRAAGNEYVLSNRQMYLCLLEEVPIKPTAMLVKREMFLREGTFDELWPSGTDWDLLIRFSRSAGFGYIDLPLVIQRRGADATHQKFREQDKLFLLNVFMTEKRRLKGDREALAVVNRGISDHCSNLAWNYLRSGRRKKSASIYLKGFKETREYMMLLRAASVFMPFSLRNALKSAIKGN